MIIPVGGGLNKKPNSEKLQRFLLSHPPAVVMNVIFSIFLLIQPRLPFMIVVHNNHRANGLAGDD
jgi:hypothetical protein